MKLAILLLFFPLVIYAHPGKLDANGCHTNKKTGEYHCHQVKDTAKPVTKEEKSNFENVKLISVYDGDTFKVSLSCKQEVLCGQIGVRVRGVDTPEIKTENACEKAAAQKAKQFTEQFLKAGTINLRNCKRDKYFRLLCDIEVNKKDLASNLIKQKLAVKYDGGTKQKIDWCKK